MVLPPLDPTNVTHPWFVEVPKGTRFMTYSVFPLNVCFLDQRFHHLLIAGFSPKTNGNHQIWNLEAMSLNLLPMYPQVVHHRSIQDSIRQPEPCKHTPSATLAISPPSFDGNPKGSRSHLLGVSWAQRWRETSRAKDFSKNNDHQMSNAINENEATVFMLWTNVP